MVSGRVLSETAIKQSILDGEFAVNFTSAIRKFGTQFITVTPIPDSCRKLLSVDPTEQIEHGVCYVRKPANL